MSAIVRAMRSMIGVLAALALALSLWATSRGAGVSPDSVRYLAASRSIPHGAVLDSTGAPLTHFPPGYPAALTLGPPRVVQAVLFAAMIAAIGFGTITLGGTPLAGVLAALFVLSSASIAETGAWLWSEPLAIALAVIGMALLERRPVWSAAAIAASILTRYAFGAFGLAGAVLTWKRHGWRAALRWAAIAWLPFVAWLVRNRLATQGATDRHLAWHPPPWAMLRFGPMNLGGWIDPRPVYAWVAIAMGLGVLAMLVSLCVRPPNAAIETLAGSAVAYLVCLLAARCVADAAIPFLPRLMAPAGVLVAMIAAMLVAPRRWLVAIAALLIAVKGYDTVRWADGASRSVLFRHVVHVTIAE